MTTNNKCVVLGAGGHAKVIVDILQTTGYEVAACLSKEPSSQKILDVPILNGDELLSQFYHEGIKSAFIAIGENSIRLHLGKKAEEIGYTLINAISAHAYIAASVTLGKGIAVMPGTVINAQVSIGDYTIINTGACVDHDCRIGRAVHIAPGSTLCGNVIISDQVWIGAGTTVIENISIDTNSYIGAGSVVIKNIPQQSLAYGVPAKIISAINHV